MTTARQTLARQGFPDYDGGQKVFPLWTEISSTHRPGPLFELFSGKLFDRRGLYPEVFPAGGKWWRLKYRFEGKEKRLSLGVYPDVIPNDARKRRDAARKLVARRHRPSENRKAQKSARAERAANSFGVVAREWYAKYSATWAKDHGNRILRRFERDIFPRIGGRPSAEVTAPELLTVVQRIEDRAALEKQKREIFLCHQSKFRV